MGARGNPPKKPGAPKVATTVAPKAPLKGAVAVPTLSENLALKPASNYMTRNPAYVTPSSSIRMAMQMMLNHKISGLPVVDVNQTCIGVYSEVDAMLQASHQHIDAKIKYTKPPKTVTLNTKLRDVLIFLVQNRLKRVPVVDGQKKLAGIITRRDVMKVFFEDYQKENP